ncbi:hypothetical protein J6590_101060 [Homalodisca vitripennis]|nr:hypothetical protein J6590_101060 [Homalodisca vitripennis]
MLVLIVSSMLVHGVDWASRLCVFRIWMCLTQCKYEDSHKTDRLLYLQRDTRHHGTAKQHDTHGTMVHLKSATQDNHGAAKQHDTRHHGSPKQRDTRHHGTAKQHDTRHHGSPKQRDTRYHRAAKHTAHDTMVHLNSVT